MAKGLDTAIAGFFVGLRFALDTASQKQFTEAIKDAKEDAHSATIGAKAMATAFVFASVEIARTYSNLKYMSDRTRTGVQDIQSFARGFEQVGSTAEAARSAIDAFALKRQNLGVGGSNMLASLFGVSDSDNAVQAIDKAFAASRARIAAGASEQDRDRLRLIERRRLEAAGITGDERFIRGGFDPERAPQADRFKQTQDALGFNPQAVQAATQQFNRFKQQFTAAFDSVTTVYEKFYLRMTVPIGEAFVAFTDFVIRHGPAISQAIANVGDAVDMVVADLKALGADLAPIVFGFTSLIGYGGDLDTVITRVSETIKRMHTVLEVLAAFWLLKFIPGGKALQGVIRGVFVAQPVGLLASLARVVIGYDAMAAAAMRAAAAARMAFAAQTGGVFPTLPRVFAGGSVAGSAGRVAGRAATAEGAVAGGVAGATGARAARAAGGAAAAVEGAVATGTAAVTAIIAHNAAQVGRETATATNLSGRAGLASRVGAMFGATSAKMVLGLAGKVAGGLLEFGQTFLLTKMLLDIVPDEVFAGPMRKLGILGKQGGDPSVLKAVAALQAQDAAHPEAYAPKGGVPYPDAGTGAQAPRRSLLGLDARALLAPQTAPGAGNRSVTNIHNDNRTSVTTTVDANFHGAKGAASGRESADMIGDRVEKAGLNLRNGAASRS